MIKRCIMIFPKFENENVFDEIREKYDPLVSHVEKRPRDIGYILNKN